MAIANLDVKPSRNGQACSHVAALQVEMGGHNWRSPNAETLNRGGATYENKMLYSTTQFTNENQGPFSTGVWAV